MATEAGDIICIKDEDVLRRMWHNTEDFARKKEIRAHMYKLREQRLKEFYTTGEVLSDVQSVTPDPSEVTGKSEIVPIITKYSDTGAMTLTDAIEDQGFMAMKSREVRDSESPTRTLELSQSNRANNAQNYWKVESSSDSYHAVGSGGQYEVTSQSQRRSMAGENDQVISDISTSSGSRTIQDREGNRITTHENNLQSSDGAGDGFNSFRKLNNGDSETCTTVDSSRAVIVGGKLMSAHQSLAHQSMAHKSSVHSQQSEAWSSSTSKSSSSKVTSSSYSTAAQDFSDKDSGDVWIEEGPGGVTRTVRVVKKFDDKGDQGGVTTITRIVKTTGTSGDYIGDESSGVRTVTVEKTSGKESRFQGDSRTQGSISTSNIQSSNGDYFIEDGSGGTQRVITKIIRTSGTGKDGHYIVEDHSGGTVVTEKIRTLEGRSVDDKQKVKEESIYKYEERKSQTADHKTDDATDVKHTVTSRDSRTIDDSTSTARKGLLQRNEEIVSRTTSAEERRRTTTEMERKAFVTQSGQTVTETVTSDRLIQEKPTSKSEADRQIQEKPTLKSEVVDITERQFKDDKTVSVQSRRESTHLETEKMKSEYTSKEETDSKVKSDMEKSGKVTHVKERVPHQKPEEYSEKTGRITQRGDITVETETIKITRDEGEKNITQTQQATHTSRSETDKAPKTHDKPDTVQTKREDTQESVPEKELIIDNRTSGKTITTSVSTQRAAPKDLDVNDKPTGKRPVGTDVAQTQPEREPGKGKQPEAYGDDKKPRKDSDKPGNAPTDTKPGSYTTTYQWSFTPQKINVEVSASHAAFASSLRAPSLSPDRGFVPYKSSSDITYTCGRKSPAKSTSRSSLERTTPTPRKSYSPELRKNSRTSPDKTSPSPSQKQDRKPSRKGSEPRSVSPKSKATPVTIDGRPAAKTQRDQKSPAKDKRKLSGTKRRSGTPGVSPSSSPERQITKTGKTRTNSSSSESSRLTYNRDMRVTEEEKYSGVTDFIRKEREDRETKKFPRTPAVDRLREKSPEYSSDGSLAQELYPKSPRQPSSKGSPKDNAFTPIRPYDTQNMSKPRRPSTSSSPSTSPERKLKHTTGTPTQRQPKIEYVTPDGRKAEPKKAKGQDMDRNTMQPDKPKSQTPGKRQKEDLTPKARPETTKPDTRPNDKPNDHRVTPDGKKITKKPGTRPGEKPNVYEETPDSGKVPQKPNTKPGDKPNDHRVTPDGRRVTKKPNTQPGDEPDDFDVHHDGRRVPRKPGTRPGEEPDDYVVTPDGRNVPHKPGTKPGDEPDDHRVTPDGRRVTKKPGTKPGDEPDDYYYTPDGKKMPDKPGTRPGDEPDDYDVTPDGRRVPRKPGTRPGEEPEGYDVTPDGRRVPRKPGTRPGDEPNDYDVTPDGRRVPRKPGTRPGDEPDDYDVTPDGRRVPRKPGTRPGDEPDDYDVTPDGRRVPRKQSTRPGDEPDDHRVTPDGRRVTKKPSTQPGEEPEDYDVTPDGRRVPRKQSTRPGDEPDDYDVTPDGRRVPRKQSTRPGDEPDDYDVTPDGRRVPRKPGTRPGDEPDDYDVTPDGRRVPRKQSTRPGDEPDDHRVTPDGRRVTKKPSTQPGEEPEDYDVTPDGRRVPRKQSTRPGDEPDDHRVTPDGRRVTKKPSTQPGEEPEDYDVTPDGRRVPRKPGTRPGEEPEGYDVTPDGRRVPRKPGTRPGDEPDDYDVTPDGRRGQRKPSTRPDDESEDYYYTPDGKKVPHKPGRRPGEEPDDYDVTPDYREVPRKPGSRPTDKPNDHRVTPDGRRVTKKPGTRTGDEPDDYYITPDGRRVPRKPGIRPGDKPNDHRVTPDGRRVMKKPGTRPQEEPDDYVEFPDSKRVPQKPGTSLSGKPNDNRVTPDGRKVPKQPGTRPGGLHNDNDRTFDGKKVPFKPSTGPKVEHNVYNVTRNGIRASIKPSTLPGDIRKPVKVTPDGRTIPGSTGTSIDKKPLSRPSVRESEPNKSVPGKKAPSHEYVTSDGRPLASKKPVGKSVPTTPEKKPSTTRLVCTSKTTFIGQTTRPVAAPTARKPERGYASATMASIVRKPSDSAKTSVRHPKESTERKPKSPVLSGKPTKKSSNEPDFEDEPRRRSTTSVTDFTSERYSEIREQRTTRMEYDYDDDELNEYPVDNEEDYLPTDRTRKQPKSVRASSGPILTPKQGVKTPTKKLLPQQKSEPKIRTTHGVTPKSKIVSSPLRKEPESKPRPNYKSKQVPKRAKPIDLDTSGEEDETEFTKETIYSEDRQYTLTEQQRIKIRSKGSPESERGLKEPKGLIEFPESPRDSSPEGRPRFTQVDDKRVEELRPRYPDSVTEAEDDSDEEYTQRRIKSKPETLTEEDEYRRKKHKTSPEREEPVDSEDETEVSVAKRVNKFMDAARKAGSSPLPSRPEDITLKGLDDTINSYMESNEIEEDIESVNAVRKAKTMFENIAYSQVNTTARRELQRQDDILDRPSVFDARRKGKPETEPSDDETIASKRAPSLTQERKPVEPEVLRKENLLKLGICCSENIFSRDIFGKEEPGKDTFPRRKTPSPERPVGKFDTFPTRKSPVKDSTLDSPTKRITPDRAKSPEKGKKTEEPQTLKSLSKPSETKPVTSRYPFSKPKPEVKPASQKPLKSTSVMNRYPFNEKPSESDRPKVNGYISPEGRYGKQPSARIPQGTDLKSPALLKDPLKHKGKQSYDDEYPGFDTPRGKESSPVSRRPTDSYSIDKDGSYPRSDSPKKGYSSRSPVRTEKSPSPNRISRGGSSSPSRSVPRDRGYPSDEPRDVKERSPTGRRGTESPKYRRGSPDSRSPSDRRGSPSRNYPQEKMPLDERNYPSSRSPTGRRRDYPDDNTRRSPSPDSKRPGSPRRDYRSRDLPEDTSPKARRPSGKTYPEEGRPMYKSPTRKDYPEDERDKYRRPSSDYPFDSYPGGRSKPREGSPRGTDEVTVSKFGVSLKKTTTGSSIMRKLFSDVGRKESELDRIFDLEVLETLLERAKGYDERRLIRQQIRIVKKMIENGELPEQPTRKKSEPDVYDSQQPSRDTDSPYFKLKKDDRREPSGRSSKSPEKNVFDRRSPEKQQPGRFQPVDSIRRRSEDKQYTTEVRRQSSEHFTSSFELKRPTSSKPSDTLNKTVKKSYIDDEPREESLTDSITSSYGIGPTDEKGMPLFGLKALRRQNKTTQEVEPSFEPFEEEPSPRDIKDSSGRPLFGLKALQVSKTPAANNEDKPVSEPNDRPLVKDILNKRDKETRGNAVSQPQQHAPSRFRDTFPRNRNEDFIRKESDSEDVKRVIKDRGQSLKSMIQRHESLTESDRKRPETVTTSSSFTSSTVVRSSAVRKPDGGISVKSQVVQGESISKDGEKPKSRVVTAEYSYETPEGGYDEFGNETISDEEYRNRETMHSTSKSIKSRSNTTESITSRTSRKSLSPERKPSEAWPSDDNTTRTRRPISDKLSQLSRKFSNEPEDLLRKSEPRTEPHYTSHTSSSLLHSNAFSSTTTTHTDRNVSSRYQPDVETSGRRRSGTPQDDILTMNLRRSSTPLDELKESLFRKSSVTHEETDSSSTVFSRYGRGGAVKALSQKFQQPRAEAESHKNTASYPKAGLVLRSARFKQTNGDLTPPDSPAYKQSVSLEARVGSPTRSGNTTPRLGHESKFVDTNERVTEGSRRWSRDGDNDYDGYSQTSRRVTTSVTETTDAKSFLGSNTKVTGVKDIIDRMKAADIDDDGLESPEDIQARSLLNKFLGASVMMSGMEPLVSASGNSSATLVSQVERQRILQSSPGESFVSKSYVTEDSLNDYGNIDNIWDEKKLRKLLDACTDYEGRRKIRARLRTVMAEKSACEDLVSAAHEEESLKSGDGSKSVQAGESLLPYLVEKLRNSLLLESLPSQKSEEGLSVTHVEDSGTESGEDFRLLVGLRDSICEGRHVKKSEQLNTKLLTEVQEALQKLQVSLNNRDDNSLDPTTRETLLQLVTRLQSSLKMAPGISQNFETKSPNRNRFANRRLARQNRHTVGVTQEELADARRLIQENSLIENSSAFNGSGQGKCLPKSENMNQIGSDQAVTSYAVVKQNSADDVTSNSSFTPVKLFRPVHFNPGKLKLPVQSCNAPPKPFLSSQQIQSADQWVRNQIGSPRRLSEGCSVPSPNYSIPNCLSPPMPSTNCDVSTETKPDSIKVTAQDKDDQTRETTFRKPPSPPYKNIQYSPSVISPLEAPLKTEPESPKFPPCPGQGLAHSKSVSNNIQNIRPRSPMKHSLSTDNGDSVLEYDPSLRLFTPEQSVKIAVHKAAINKQLSQEEEKRMRKMSVESDIGSTEDEAMEEDGDISSVSEDENESTVKLGKIGKTYPASQMNSQKGRRQNFGLQDKALDQKSNNTDYNSVDNVNHCKHYGARDYGKHYSGPLSDEEKKNLDREPLNRFEKRIQEIQNERKTGKRQNVRSIEELQKIYLDRKEKYNERKTNPDTKSQIIQDVQAKYQRSISDQVSNPKSCNPQRLNPEIRSKYENEIRKITENDVRSKPIWNEDDNCRRRKEPLKSVDYVTALEQNYFNPPLTPMDVSQTDSEISLSSTSTESSFSHAQRLLRLATGNKSSKSSKKVKMKRANTIDIPKPANYYDVDNYSDYTDDEQKSSTYSSTVKAMKPSVPNLEPKTESDKKFLAFLQQQNQPKLTNAIWSKDHEPHRGNPFAEHQWGNRFSRIKTSFENVDEKNERPVKKLSVPSAITGARAFWKTADDSAIIRKDALSLADRPKLTKQRNVLSKKLFQQTEAEEKPTRLPWTGPKENVVVGTLTVYPQRNEAINKSNLNQFSHAPMSAFRPVERKADAAKTYHGPAAKFAKPIPVNPNMLDSGPSLPWLKDKSADKTLINTVAKFENLSSRETSPAPVPHREKFLDKLNFIPTYQDQPRIMLPVQSNIVHTQTQAFSSNYPNIKCNVNPISNTASLQSAENEFYHPVTTYSVDVATTSTVYPKTELDKVDSFDLLDDSAVSTPEEQMAVIKVMGSPIQQQAVTITQKTHRRNDESENRTTAAKSLTNMLQRFSSPPSDKSPEHARTRGSIPDVNYSKSSLVPPNLPTGKLSPTSPGNRSASPYSCEEKLTIKSGQLARPLSAESLAMSNSSEELGENCEGITSSRLQIPVSPGQYRTSSMQDLSPVESPNQFLVSSASPVGSLRKSESCHQLNAPKPKRPQSLILPDLPAPQRRTPTSLTKTKSSHALAFPKQFEAVINPAAVEMKQKTVEEFFSVKKRTKKEVKTNFVELDDNLENVDEAFDALFSSVSSGNVSAKKPHKSDMNDGYRPRNQISKSISSSAIQEIRNFNTSSSITTTTTKSSDGGYSKISSEKSVFSTVGTTKAASTNKPISPFAKFQQLDRQSSGSSSTPSSPSAGKAPLFTFTDPKLSRSASGVKDRLLQWCQLKTKNYKNIQIENFSTSWSNGLAFCALIHHFRPEAFDYDALTPKERRKNFELAFKVAEEEAGIAPLLDVEDMVMMRKPDWKCVFTYVQSIYCRFKNED